MPKKPEPKRLTGAARRRPPRGRVWSDNLLAANLTPTEEMNVISVIQRLHQEVKTLSLLGPGKRKGKP